MFDFNKAEKQFKETCTACGLCVECCPIVSHTDLKGVASEKIMQDVLDLFQYKTIGDFAHTRIYSCLYCNSCVDACPVGLNPGLAFSVAKKTLVELGDPIPEGIASILPNVEASIENSLKSFQKSPEKYDWLITDINKKELTSAKTVLFASCFGLAQPDVLETAVKILQRIDPSVKVLGGLDYCCGELYLLSGQPEKAGEKFGKLIEGLNAFSPENVLILCPSCNMNFDLHHPDSLWPWVFVTDFIAEHLDLLGPLKEVKATVTVHDPCHFVRGVTSGSDSPRQILNAIPGITIVEMENVQKKSLSCGAYAILGTGLPGMEFRDRRLKQAQDTGADILSLYCPGCNMILGTEAHNRSFRIESIITLLGESLGIE
jgi:Fe-S oxidoreductase